MPGSTSLDVHNKTFTRARRGYAIDEVDAFLDEVAEELTRLTQASAGAHEPPIGRADEQAIARALVTAQRAAEQTLNEAKAKAQTIIAAAQAKATQTTDAAQIQARETLEETELHARQVKEELAQHRWELEKSIQALQAFEGDYRDRLRECVEELMTTLESSAPTEPVAPPAPPGLLPTTG
jgi:cell division initiation protein